MNISTFDDYRQIKLLSSEEVLDLTKFCKTNYSLTDVHLSNSATKIILNSTEFSNFTFENNSELKTEFIHLKQKPQNFDWLSSFVNCKTVAFGYKIDSLPKEVLSMPYLQLINMQVEQETITLYSNSQNIAQINCPWEEVKNNMVALNCKTLVFGFAIDGIPNEIF